MLFRGFAWETEKELHEVYLRRGYRIVRHEFRMEIDLDEEPSAPQWPEGIGVHTFESGRDERAVYDAVNESFADMWGHTASPYEEWAHHMSAEGEFDPTLWWFARVGDEIAAICLGRPQGATRTSGGSGCSASAGPGAVAGSAQALLLNAFHEFRARGRSKAGLGVDAESTTGAIELYKAGMRPVRTGNIYDLEVASSR